MKNSLLPSEKFILKWTVISFAVTLVFSLFFYRTDFKFIIGLTLGTFLSIIKFLLSSFNIKNALEGSNGQVGVFKLSVINFLSMIIMFLLIVIFFTTLGNIEISTVLGFFIGVSYISLVILITGVLQAKYIIRNKI